MRWVERRYETLFIAEDGEVIDSISPSSTYGTWVVKSTGKRYVTESDARSAVEKQHSS